MTPPPSGESFRAAVCSQALPLVRLRPRAELARTNGRWNQRRERAGFRPLRCRGPLWRGRAESSQQHSGSSADSDPYPVPGELPRVQRGCSDRCQRVMASSATEAAVVAQAETRHMPTQRSRWPEVSHPRGQARYPSDGVRSDSSRLQSLVPSPSGRPTQGANKRRRCPERNRAQWRPFDPSKPDRLLHREADVSHQPGPTPPPS